MRLTEATTPPPEYQPERTPRIYTFGRLSGRLVSNDLAETLYRGWACEAWAFRHWMTGHNKHVEHWHGVSLPGRPQ